MYSREKIRKCKNHQLVLYSTASRIQAILVLRHIHCEFSLWLHLWTASDSIYAAASGSSCTCNYMYIKKYKSLFRQREKREMCVYNYYLLKTLNSYYYNKQVTALTHVQAIYVILWKHNHQVIIQTAHHLCPRYHTNVQCIYIVSEILTSTRQVQENFTIIIISDRHGCNNKSVVPLDSSLLPSCKFVFECVQGLWPVNKAGVHTGGGGGKPGISPPPPPRISHVLYTYAYDNTQ